MAKSVLARFAEGALCALLLAASAGAQTSAEEEAAVEGSCVLLSMELRDDAGEALLMLTTEGKPASLGARIEPGEGVVLDLSGCVAGPDLSRHTYADGLVSSLQIVQRSASGGPVTAVKVKTRRPFEYTVDSDHGNVELRLRPDGDDAARPQVRVLEPLPRPDPEPPLPAEQDAAADASEGPASPVAEIAERVKRWAEAWSGQRIEDYLSFYASSFRPSRSASRQAWEAQRRERLAAPRFIEVTFEGLEVQVVDPGLASASFWQTYTSDRFTDRIYKTQTWVEENGDWRILEEQVASPQVQQTSQAPLAAELGARVQQWALAWSEQRVEDYLAFYASAFRPPWGASREAWEAERRERLSRPSFIEVSLEGLLVEIVGPDRASASFWQGYASDSFSDLVYKTQTWIEEEGGWKILEERVVTPPAIMRQGR